VSYSPKRYDRYRRPYAHRAIRRSGFSQPRQRSTLIKPFGWVFIFVLPNNVELDLKIDFKVHLQLQTSTSTLKFEIHW